MGRWDGHNWLPVGKGLTILGITDLEVYDDGSGARLYFSGGFTLDDDPDKHSLASWNGAAWSAVPSPAEWSPNSWGITKLCNYSEGCMSKLVASAGYSGPDHFSRNCIIAWNGKSWSVLADKENFLKDWQGYMYVQYMGVIGAPPLARLLVSGNIDLFDTQVQDTTAQFGILPAQLPGTVEFESPGYQSDPAGRGLTGQWGWTKSIVGTPALSVYPYGSDEWGLPLNPTGKHLFTAPCFDADGRAILMDHPVDFSASEDWDVGFDFVARFEGAPSQRVDLARFVVHPRVDCGMRARIDWDDPLTRDSWSLTFDSYDAAGKSQTLSPGPAWSGIDADGWKRVEMKLELPSNRITQIVLRDGAGAVLANTFPVGWYLLGGNNPTMPPRTQIRLATAAVETAVPGNLTGWDNVTVRPGNPACRPDCDGSGILDLFDFLCFVNLFNVSRPEADCNLSGDFDLFDFLCFTNQFNMGC
jgi:hypothetical protein